MSFTRDIIKGLKDAITRKHSVKWADKAEEGSLIWRLPNKVYPNTGEVSKFVVNEDERVAVYLAGNFRSLLAPGQHAVVDDFDSAVYVDVSPKIEKVGIRAPNYPITSDGKSFGCSGNIEFSVQEDQVAIGNFLSKLVGTNESYTPKKLANWLRDGLLFQVFKEIIKDYTYNEFIEMERIRLLMELEVKLGAELRSYGVEIVTLELRHFTPPRSF